MVHGGLSGPGSAGSQCGFGLDAAPPAATLRGVLPAARSPGHSGASPGLAGEGGGPACGLRIRRAAGRWMLSHFPGAALRGSLPARGKDGGGGVLGRGVTVPLEIRNEAITFVRVKEWCRAVRVIWRLSPPPPFFSFLSQDQGQRLRTVLECSFCVFHRSSWLVTQEAGLGPFGHPFIWRPSSAPSPHLPRKGSLGVWLPSLFSLVPWIGVARAGPHLSATPEGPRVKNRGIVVTRPALCNRRLSLLESKIAFNYCDKVDPSDFGEEAVKQVSFFGKMVPVSYFVVCSQAPPPTSGFVNTAPF